MGRVSYSLILLILFNRCITPVEFESSGLSGQLVVEGRITNLEPPYQVNLSRSMDLNKDTVKLVPETDAVVILFDNQGNTEALIETDPGKYETSGYLQGTVGRSYYIYIETQDGAVYTSQPEVLQPVGRITNLKYQFEGRTKLVDYGEVNADVFNVYVDADGGAMDAPLIRWKMTGLFKVETYPALHEIINPPYDPLKDPLPCSGYIVDGGPIFSGGVLKRVGPCTCCICWVSQYEDLPQLSDQYSVSNNQYQNVKVGEIPITNYTFFEKYRVEVEQMTLSPVAFDFFKSIRSQKIGAADLFQPQVGGLLGNIIAEDPSDPVIGLFYAAAVHKASTYIFRSEVPYELTPITFITDACDQAYQFSSSEKPEEWIN